MVEKKWYEAYNDYNKNEGFGNDYNGNFNNDMALEYKYGRDLFNSKYRREHGMVQVTSYDLERMMQDCGFEE